MTPSRLLKVATTILRIWLSCRWDGSMSPGRMALPRADRSRQIFPVQGAAGCVGERAEGRFARLDDEVPLIGVASGVHQPERKTARDPGGLGGVPRMARLIPG